MKQLKEIILASLKRRAKAAGKTNKLLEVVQVALEHEIGPEKEQVLRAKGYVTFEEFMSELSGLPTKEAEEIIAHSSYQTTNAGVYVLPAKPSR